ncbi:MAE_28990/MAE_18760 family HEPN-like nuclease [Paracoccus aminophilus]|uniref:MAE_28990/MAE_18760 family HEPN-like nuclease n=1 Tax=Paracoccus aminophilus TaxID=34003 RepID=UPI0011DDC70A|nr:MAE_28990/MAE_18760 family HEPN-like nuclease [Paracoccus aminophilus]
MEIDRIRSWRKLELSQARAIAESRAGRAEEAYLCRSWAVMIYAHCDQAIKAVSRAYLDYLKVHPREGYDYRTAWLSFHGKEAIRHSSDARYLLCRPDVAEFRTDLIGGINQKAVIDTSNFSYPMLRFLSDWVVQCTFDHSLYRAFCSTLKEKRDAIAHGEEIFLRSVDDCISWHDPAISLLDGFSESALETALLHPA